MSLIFTFVRAPMIHDARLFEVFFKLWIHLQKSFIIRGSVLAKAKIGIFYMSVARLSMLKAL